MGWISIDLPDELAEIVRQKAEASGQTPADFVAHLVQRGAHKFNDEAGDMTSKAPQPGKYPALATALLDESARLRSKARELGRTPPPAPPGSDKSETFAKLWAEAWQRECGIVADRFGDAAKILEDAASGISPTHDLVTWRRP